MVNSARGLENREKVTNEKVWQRPPPPPPSLVYYSPIAKYHTAFGKYRNSYYMDLTRTLSCPGQPAMGSDRLKPAPTGGSIPQVTTLYCFTDFRKDRFVTRLSWTTVEEILLLCLLFFMFVDS